MSGDQKIEKENKELYLYPLNLNSLCNAYRLFKLNKSPVRIIHNLFLKKIYIKGDVLDAGAGTHASYLKFINKTDCNIETMDFFKKSQNKQDLEKNLEIENKKYDSVLLFNTLEHIYNYKNLIKELNRILKDKGNLEIYVPFLIGYHPDPNDVFRPTHDYLFKILSSNNFNCKTTLIGVGPFIVSFEMLFRYLKFAPLKIIFFILANLLDRLLKKFSKDFETYYAGVHISAVKL